MAAALLTFVLLAVLLRYRSFALDRPNERSLHTRPVPRVGGLAVICATAISWTLVLEAIPKVIWMPAAALFLLSLADDLVDLPVLARLFAHMLAALLVGIGLILPHAGLAAALVVSLAIAWMINLYNFMDGSDGLAGGMTSFGFLGYGVAAWTGGAYEMAFACMSVSAASAAFLWFNFHPARVFLGDSGSVTLGFLAAALGAHGWLQGLWPLWFPALVFSPFLVDASVTLARRTLRREKIWQAHREHYYQRLVRAGWGHRRTALAEYVLMAGCMLTALAGIQAPRIVQGMVLAAWALCYLVLAMLVDRAWRKHALGAGARHG